MCHFTRQLSYNITVYRFNICSFMCLLMLNTRPPPSLVLFASIQLTSDKPNHWQNVLVTVFSDSHQLQCYLQGLFTPVNSSKWRSEQIVQLNYCTITHNKLLNKQVEYSVHAVLGNIYKFTDFVTEYPHVGEINLVYLMFYLDYRLSFILHFWYRFITVVYVYYECYKF